MRTYFWVWGAIASITSAVAFIASGFDVGWPALAATAIAVSMLGSLMGLIWSGGGPSRWRNAILYGLQFGLSGVLLVGLPALIGSWSFLVVLLFWSTSPPLAAFVVRRIRQRLPSDSGDRARHMSDRDLVRRWRRTAAELRHPSTSPAMAVKLVQERALLLDEVERRDTDSFADSLVRAGWHSSNSVVD